MSNPEKEPKEMSYENTYDDIIGKTIGQNGEKNGNEAQSAEITEVEIVGVRFKKNGKIYYFSPVKEQYEQNTAVIVETARGLEYGNVMIANKIVTSDKITLPLRNVVRVATEEDEKHHNDNMNKEIDAYNLCVRKIAEHRLTMKLVDVEYTFDNSKLLFYFTAEGRIDFRDLVKDLASIFKTRIELRQIGIRDEAKLIGGLGICGRPFCCHSFLSDFVQVSIKMAKEQSLSLNSTKISGACGRLMCCLRYEYDVYEEEIKKTPKVGTIVITPDGHGTVIETMPLAGLCRVLPGDNKDQSPKVYHRDDLQPNDGWKPEPKEQKDIKETKENKDKISENQITPNVILNQKENKNIIPEASVNEQNNIEIPEAERNTEKSDKPERQERNDRQINRRENIRGNRGQRNNRYDRQERIEKAEENDGLNESTVRENVNSGISDGTENRQEFRRRDNRPNFRKNNGEIRNTENINTDKAEKKEITAEKNSAEKASDGTVGSEIGEQRENRNRYDRQRGNYRHGQRHNQRGNRQEGTDRQNRQDRNDKNDKK